MSTLFDPITHISCTSCIICKLYLSYARPTCPPRSPWRRPPCSATSRWRSPCSPSPWQAAPVLPCCAIHYLSFQIANSSLNTSCEVEQRNPKLFLLEATYPHLAKSPDPNDPDSLPTTLGSPIVQGREPGIIVRSFILLSKKPKLQSRNPIVVRDVGKKKTGKCGNFSQMGDPPPPPCLGMTCVFF